MLDFPSDFSTCGEVGSDGTVRGNVRSARPLGKRDP